MTKTNTELSWIPAAEVAVGDALVERDGYMLAVMGVRRERGLVVLRCASDYSPMAAWRSTGTGIRCARRPATKLPVVRGAGYVAVPSLRPAAESNG